MFQIYAMGKYTVIKERNKCTCKSEKNRFWCIFLFEDRRIFTARNRCFILKNLGFPDSRNQSPGRPPKKVSGVEKDFYV